MFNEKAYKFSTRDDTTFRATGGEKELPDVTDADNGKVLTVVDGAWAASGNSSTIIIAEEQNVTCEYHKGDPTLGLEPTVAAHGMVESGNIIFLTIDDVTYSGEAEIDSNGWSVFIEGSELETGIGIKYDADEDFIYVNDISYAGLVIGNSYIVEIGIENVQPMPEIRFDVIFTPQPGFNNYAINETYDAIVGALGVGRIIQAYLDGSAGYTYFNLSEVGENGILFTHLEFDVENSLMIYHYFTLSSNDTLTYNYVTYKLTEPIT